MHLWRPLESLTFGIHSPLSLYPQTSNFGLSKPHFWTSLIDTEPPPTTTTLGSFEIFLEKFNNEIMRSTW